MCCPTDEQVKSEGKCMTSERAIIYIQIPMGVERGSEKRTEDQDFTHALMIRENSKYESERKV